jgi:hypothetical protein
MTSAYKLASVLLLTLSSCMASKSVEIRPVGAASPVTADEAYAEAKRQLERGNIGLAIDGFRKAVRRSPESVDAMNGLAVAYDRLGRFDLSRRFYELALAAQPSNAKVRNNLAISLKMQGRNEEAAALRAESTGVQVAVTLAPLPAREPAAVVRDGPRLERLSTQEIVLVTIGGPSREIQITLDDPAPRASAPQISPPVAATTRAKPSGLLVMNAVGRRGQAKRLRHYLAGVGWREVAVGDSKQRLVRSVILFPRGERASAEHLANTLPFRPRIAQSTRSARLILVLGRNATAFDDRLNRTPRS